MAPREKRQPGIDVSLGGTDFIVVPQRQARLTRRLFGAEGVFSSFDELATATGEEASFDSFYELIAGRVFDVLCVFIPHPDGGDKPFMPRWQFDGYASQTAADQDQYDEEADRSPTVPEIQEALRAAVQVNGLSWLSKIKNFVDPTVVKNQVTLAVARMGTAAQEAAGTSPRSLNSPSASGESDPTTSGTSDQTTPGQNGSDSPTRGSSSASTPEPADATSS